MKELKEIFEEAIKEKAKIVGKINLPTKKQIDFRKTGPIFRYKGVVFINTKHGNNQEFIRNSERLSQDDIVELFKRYANFVANNNIKRKSYILIYSKQFQQGVVFEFTTNVKGNNRRMTIITFLPKGKSFALDDTEKVIVEGVKEEILFFEID